MTILVSIQLPVAAWQIPAPAVARLRERCPSHDILYATSGFRPGHWDDVVDLFAANVRRWEQGAALEWQVDPVGGY